MKATTTTFQAGVFYARFQTWQNGGTQYSSKIFDNLEAYEADVEKANSSFADTKYKQFTNLADAAAWVADMYEKPKMP